MIEIWSPRVYKSRDQYAGAATLDFQKTWIIDGWTVEVTIGRFAEEVRRAAAIEMAVMPSVLRALSCVASNDPVITDDDLDRQVESFTLPLEWLGTRHVFTNIVVRRSFDEPALRYSDDSAYPWVDYSTLSKEVWAAVVSAHEGAIFERVLWLLLEELDPSLFGDIFGLPRAYLLVPDGQPWPVPREMAGGVTIVRGMAVASLLESLHRLSSREIASAKPSTHAELSVLMTQQAAEPDPFKRFIWCYAALEFATNVIASTERNNVKQFVRFASGGTIYGGRAVEELFWPDREHPESQRSILFRFAVMALTLSAATANEDVAAFAEIGKYRNLVHGKLAASGEPPLDKAVLLIQRYYPLALAYLRKGAGGAKQDQAGR